MFRRVLIANRGEFATRVASTLQQMGIAAIGVYSDADRHALHVRSMDEAYPLDGNTASETYLRGDKIIEIARRHRVDAIHPGYGFLSENAHFAERCADAGIVFIGPSPAAMRGVGDKVAAKGTFAAAGVPTLPGWTGKSTADAQVIVDEARRVGYPLLVKAAAGGGGKGMRLVCEERELRPSIEAASREAGSAFGDPRVFFERYLPKARHVEVQIFGDHHGHVVHLFERECSIQRRHQKILEESPSPIVDTDLRRRMGEAAVRAARAANYANAGTVEFLVDENGDFYFLEVNARLQVEHPVTELVVGHDLVAAQVRVAAGESLPFTQESLTQTGHAMEVRICAEDPARDFLPSIGRIEQYIPPTARNIRVDSGVAAGSEVSVYYDSMLAKLIVWGRDRQESLRRMDWALRRFVVLGVTTNIEFLRALINDPDVAAGRMHTQFLQEKSVAPLAADHEDLASAVAVIAGQRSSHAASDQRHAMSAVARHTNPWRDAGAWRSCTR